MAESKHYVAFYLNNLVTAITPSSTMAAGLISYLLTHGDDVGLHLEDDDLSVRTRSKSRRLRIFRKRASTEIWADIRETLAVYAGQNAKAPIELEANLATFASDLHFDPVEVAILRLGLAMRLYKDVENLMGEVIPDVRTGKDFAKALAAVLGHSYRDVSKRLSRESRLLSSGVLKFDREHYRIDHVMRPLDPVVEALSGAKSSQEKLRSLILGKPAQPNLEWTDFEHASDVRDNIFAILAGALKSHAKAVNILLYGPPGTGKTEIAKRIAAQLGAKLYSIGERNADGDEPSRDDRLSELMLAQSMLGGNDGVLFMVDEMEDLSISNIIFGKESAGSRIFMNRLLEENPSPVIWICNDLSEFDEAFRRRMIYAAEMRNPPISVRESIWAKVMKREGLAFDADLPRNLAKKYPVAPAVATNAIRAVKLCDGGAEAIPPVMNGLMKMLRGGHELPPLYESHHEWDPELTNADENLTKLTARLAHSPRRDFSLCLFGPPGTGKSFYARHLANVMKLPVTHIRASDIISSFVGETEQNIARAFALARESGSLLIFDEADSFLTDRAAAKHSWEISGVNEMLTWMEAHPLPFVCTTNLKDRLDQASLRRFTFKSCFNALRPEQARTAFKRFFNAKPPEGGVLPSNLTPGDFALVAKKAALLDQLEDSIALVRMLELESRVKSDGNVKPIGFKFH